MTDQEIKRKLIKLANMVQECGELTDLDKDKFIINIRYLVDDTKELHVLMAKDTSIALTEMYGKED